MALVRVLARVLFSTVKLIVYSTALMMTMLMTMTLASMGILLLSSIVSFLRAEVTHSLVDFSQLRSSENQMPRYLKWLEDCM